MTTRPTETLTGLALAAAIYGFLTQASVSTVLAAIIAVAIAFVPAAISAIVDAIRDKPGPPATMESRRSRTTKR